MNSANKPIIKDVFLNVRKAYRLLHEHQCMVRDAIRYISAQLDIQENMGRAKFASDASTGQKWLQHPSWDWLPMMGCEFHFLKPLPNTEFISLSLLVISDTGFIEADDKMTDKENIPAFEKAEKSSTKFAFILRKSHWDHLSFMDDKAQMRNFIKEDGNLPDDLIHRGFVGKCYPMSCLTSENEADIIIREIIAVAKKNDWPLELRNPNTSASTAAPAIPAWPI